MKTPHTSCARGTRVRVVLRSGEVIVAKFVERTGKFVLLEGHRLRGADIRTFGIKK
ncbi:hypothetical protein [Caballeronia sp. AZ10_KS36]|uniref:hypothetical protein n=1 Tax=Caballeronia sp. AZ10_KS36 TaxID=2921757 RepID=UPI0020293E17|nr:hypothetical protein [Caballeronia sp. AZ10_KS36]